MPATQGHYAGCDVFTMALLAFTEVGSAYIGSADRPRGAGGLDARLGTGGMAHGCPACGPGCTGVDNARLKVRKPPGPARAKARAKMRKKVTA